MSMYLLGVASVIVPIAYTLRLIWLRRYVGLTHREANTRATTEFATILSLIFIIGLSLFSGPFKL